MAKSRQIIIPARYFKITKTRATSGTRDKKSGRMTGRKAVDGKGDETYTRRVVKDYDYDGDKKPDIFKGEIFGRVSKSDVRSSKRAKGYVRQI